MLYTIFPAIVAAAIFTVVGSLYPRKPSYLIVAGFLVGCFWLLGFGMASYEYGAGEPASLDVLERGVVHTTVSCMDNGVPPLNFLLASSGNGVRLYRLGDGQKCPEMVFVAVEVEGKLQLLPYENTTETSGQ